MHARRESLTWCRSYKSQLVPVRWQRVLPESSLPACRLGLARRGCGASRTAGRRRFRNRRQRCRSTLIATVRTPARRHRPITARLAHQPPAHEGVDLHLATAKDCRLEGRWRRLDAKHVLQGQPGTGTGTPARLFDSFDEVAVNHNSPRPSTALRTLTFSTGTAKVTSADFVSAPVCAALPDLPRALGCAAAM